LIPTPHFPPKILFQHSKKYSKLLKIFPTSKHTTDFNSSSTIDHKSQVRQMLMGLALAEFVKLPLEQRNEVYERYLAKDGYV
jgi:hypothetical protein